MKIGKNFKILLSVFLVFALAFPMIPGVQADTNKKLNNVISKITIWDTVNGVEATKADNAYLLTEGGNYNFEVDFDLTGYNDNLQDGDYFTLTIPEPLTIENGTNIPLKHAATNLEIGNAVLTSAGPNMGGTVTVTLKNLQQYMEKTGGNGVKDVKGHFFTKFATNKVTAKQELVFPNTETNGNLSTFITVKAKGTNPVTNTIGRDSKENFAKNGGVLAKKSYNSPILGVSGEYQHPWTIRINTQQKTYDNLTVRDEVSDAGGPMQMIPESFELSSGEYLTSLSTLSNQVKLVKGVDYNVTFNSSYTAFTLDIVNPGSRAFRLFYATTSPLDGSYVGNTVRMSSNGEDIRQNDTKQAKEMTVHRTSKITEGGNISIAIDTTNQITLYKTDSKTGQKLSGAIFKVTTPGGEEITLPATDANGRTYSRKFTAQEVAAGQFTVEELVPPANHKRLTQPIKVSIGAEGVVLTIKNDPEDAPPAVTSVKVNKAWTDNNGNAIEAPNVTVKVRLHQDGIAMSKVLELTKDNLWTGSFNNLQEKSALTGEKYKYTVKEEGEDQGAIEISGKGYKVEVKENAANDFTITNKLTATPNPPNPPTPPAPNPPAPNPQNPNPPAPNPQNPNPPAPQDPKPTPQAPAPSPNNPDSNSSVPKTGDERDMPLYALIALMSGTSLLLVGYRRRKYEK